MKFILNIGLEKSKRFNDGGGSLSVVDVVRELRKYGLELGAKKIAHSDTEPTLIIEVEYPFTTLFDAVYNIANNLEQDCIAVYSPSLNKRWLIGKYANEWGEFNPKYFINLEEV